MNKSPRTRVAIQKSGRLTEGSVKFLNAMGLKFQPNGRNLVTPCENAPIDILHLRDDDIPEYVCRSVVDFGIVGENVLYEKNVHVGLLKRLGFSPCSLVIAVPKGSPIKVPEDLEGERIATSHPRLLTRFLRQRQINAAIITIRGAVEVAPQLNLSDAVCDITQTGRTLKEHDLIPLATVFESQAVLIESPFTKPDKIDFLKL
jgi:ATP phosphoribosyltransferase